MCVTCWVIVAVVCSNTAWEVLLGDPHKLSPLIVNAGSFGAAVEVLDLKFPGCCWLGHLSGLAWTVILPANLLE